MTLFWTAALALTTVLYVLLDGFDLGVGMVFGLTRSEADRRTMLATISPVWDGNETWLILTGTILFGAFPHAYAMLLSTFYVPLIAMLGALILRGVAFEFRYKAIGARWVWDASLAGGSLMAAFMQGAAIGALAVGLRQQGAQYAAGPFDWLSPFTCLCGVALCLGYVLLGLGWIVGKSEGSLQARARQRMRVISISVAGLLLFQLAYSLHLHLQIFTRWAERPYLSAFPIIGIVAAGILMWGSRSHYCFRSFALVAIIFVAAFGTFLASFWPYIIPFSMTVTQAAAPAESLRFMFWGSGLVVLPLTLVYTATVYRVFRGKVLAGSE